MSVILDICYSHSNTSLPVLQGAQDDGYAEGRNLIRKRYEMSPENMIIIQGKINILDQLAVSLSRCNTSLTLLSLKHYPANAQFLTLDFLSEIFAVL